MGAFRIGPAELVIILCIICVIPTALIAGLIVFFKNKSKGKTGDEE